MEHRTPRQKQKARTKKLLIDASLQCFDRHGFHATSIATITRTAGVAHGTFYVHFPSKDALLAELLDDFNQGLVERLAPLWRSSDLARLPGQIRASAETFLGYWAEHRGFVEAYGQKVAGGIPLTDLQEGLATPVLELLALQLENIAGALGAPLPHSQLVVQSLLALWARVGLHHLFDGSVGRDEAAMLLTRLTLGALQGVLPAAAQHWNLEDL